MMKRYFTFFLYITCTLSIAQTNTFPTSGNVGIGTTNPTSTLYINGDFKVSTDWSGSYLYYNGAADLKLQYPPRGSGGRAMVHDDGNVLTLNFMNDFTGGTKLGTSFFVRGDNGNVGIGTTNPQAKFHLVDNGVSKDGTSQFNGNFIIQANTGNRSTTQGAQLEFAIPANTDGNNVWGQGRIITVAGNANSGDASGKMILGTRRSINKLGTGTAWFYGDDITIDGGGNIGIGTANPSYNLHVIGETFSSIGFRVKGAWGDNANGAPWYGLGATTTSDLQNYVQLAGYYGLNFQTASGQIVMNDAGNVGIGTAKPQSKLAVNGTITTQEVNVINTGWSDFVFAPSYKLISLDSLSKQIQSLGHLPNMPSTADIEKNGLSLGDMSKRQQQKIEELTLYIIQLKSLNEKMQKENERLKTDLQSTNRQLSDLDKRLQLLEKNSSL